MEMALFSPQNALTLKDRFWSKKQSSTVVSRTFFYSDGKTVRKLPRGDTCQLVVGMHLHGRFLGLNWITSECNVVGLMNEQYQRNELLLT